MYAPFAALDELQAHAMTVLAAYGSKRATQHVAKDTPQLVGLRDARNMLRSLAYRLAVAASVGMVQKEFGRLFVDALKEVGHLDLLVDDAVSAFTQEEGGYLSAEPEQILFAFASLDEEYATDPLINVLSFHIWSIYDFPEGKVPTRAVDVATNRIVSFLGPDWHRPERQLERLCHVYPAEISRLLLLAEDVDVLKGSLPRAARVSYIVGSRFLLLTDAAAALRHYVKAPTPDPLLGQLQLVRRRAQRRDREDPQATM